jgi:hypothetical protein
VQEHVVNNRYEVLTPSGWSSFSGIKKTTKKGIANVTTDKGKSLRCTLDHPIRTSRGFVAANLLDNNDEVTTKDGCEHITNVHRDVDVVEEVFDLLEVKHFHEYFTNGFVSHNCQWLGSSGTLISGATLKTLIPKHAIQQKDGLNMYKDKTGNHQYVIICDVSRGKGLDYSAFQILDVTTMPYEQVCTYRNNMVTPLDYAGIIYRMSKLYNNATILVEINDVGAQVADALYFDYECENLIYTENAGSRGKRISTGFARGQQKTGGADRGIRTTKTVKAIGCSMLKLLIEQQQLIINDHQTIQELSRFSRRGSSYEAEAGSNDDLVMGLVLFAWMTDQQFFKDLTDINTLKILRDKTDEELENDLVPFGFIDTGHDDEQSMVIDLTEAPSKEFRFF